MKLLAFAASNSRTSINKALVTHAAFVFKAEFAPDAKVEIIDLTDFEMPIYSIDRENEEGIPEAAYSFFRKIGEADAVLISYAEYNGSYTSAFKNIFDWASRIEMKIFQDKPMVVMSASPGKNGGGNVLQTALSAAPHFGADIRGSLKVGRFPQSFENGVMNDPVLSVELREALSNLPQIAS